MRLTVIIICGIIALCLLSSQYGAWEENLSTNVSIQMRAKKKRVKPIILSPVSNQTVPVNDTLPQPMNGVQQINEDTGTGGTECDTRTPAQENETAANEAVEAVNDSVPQPNSVEQQTDITGSSGEAMIEVADAQEEAMEEQEPGNEEQQESQTVVNDGIDPPSDNSQNIEVETEGEIEAVSSEAQ